MNDVRFAEILLAEDSAADVRLTQEALADSKLHINLHVVPDGVEALAFLRREGDAAEAPRPDLILLDLNMPRMDGREFLEVVKQDADLRTIPIVVLTTSAEDEDIVRSYASHANCYIRKPLAIDSFFEVVKTIENFWFSIVKLPKKA